MEADINRRGFLKRWALGSVAGGGAVPWLASMLAEIGHAAPRPAVLRLRVADYPSLLSAGGSVQIQFNTIPSLQKPLTLSRLSFASDSPFYAVDTYCPHSGCTVAKYNAAEGLMRCPCHGSTYDIQGRRLGGPTPSDLRRFEVESFTQNYQLYVAVTIPDLALQIDSISVHSRVAGSTRYRLTFAVTAGVEYEVFFQASLQGAPTRIPFSLTPAGAATQTRLFANDWGDRTVYVDSGSQTGFFLVNMVLTTLA